MANCPVTVYEARINWYVVYETHGASRMKDCISKHGGQLCKEIIDLFLRSLCVAYTCLSLKKRKYLDLKFADTDISILKYLFITDK